MTLTEAVLEMVEIVPIRPTDEGFDMLKPFKDLKSGDKLISKHTNKPITLREPYEEAKGSNFGAAFHTDDPKHFVWEDNYNLGWYEAHKGDE